MADISADAKGGYRRVEILTGPARRRRWSADEKARIVAETLVPGARVSDVARRWQVCTQQVFTWRRNAACDPSTMVTDRGIAALIPAFVPITTEAAAAPVAPSTTSIPQTIEVELAGAVIRVAPGMDGATLATVLRAIRASVSRG